MNKIAQKFYDLSQLGDDTATMAYHKSNVPATSHQEFSKELKKILDKNKRKTFIYMLTFTISPTLHPVITPALENKIEDYIKKQAERKMTLGITGFSYVKEHHKDGRPHWHASLTTSKSLKKNRFQYYTKLFGNLDFSRTKGQTNQEALNYMSKEAIPITLI